MLRCVVRPLSRNDRTHFEHEPILNPRAVSSDATAASDAYYYYYGLGAVRYHSCRLTDYAGDASKAAAAAAAAREQPACEQRTPYLSRVHSQPTE